MSFIKIDFPNKLNCSVQTGDIIFASPMSTVSGIAHVGMGNNDTNTISLGTVVEFLENSIKVDNSVNGDDITSSSIYNLSTNQIASTLDIFISFVKNPIANESSLKGYYADITLTNNSSEKTELFSVTSEIAPSSK